MVHYTEENVVLVGCRHLRCMVGETDELSHRMRTDAAEREALEAVEAAGAEPEWFFERWCDDLGILCACVVFEDDKAAKRFIDWYGERGTTDANATWILVGEFWDREKIGLTRYLNAEWARRRAEDESKAVEVWDGLKEDFSSRVVVCDLDYHSDGNANDATMKAFWKNVGELVEKDKVANPKVYSAMADSEGSRLFAALGFVDAENADEFSEAIRRNYDVRCRRTKKDAMPCGMELYAVVHVMDSLKAEDEKSAKKSAK